mmetsp:Transcript_24590/g.61092  ORF Transcript_24590/g.61092 Transcript_24590/m.61092 type:complete len:332 (-) Transcript_24590:2162-3157(-)
MRAAVSLLEVDGRIDESDGRLGEGAAVEPRARSECGVGLDQEGALEVRVDAGIDLSGHLPEDVRGLGRVAGEHFNAGDSRGLRDERDLCAIARVHVAGGLEDKDIVLVALDEDLDFEFDLAAPPVYARLECLSVDEAAFSVEVGGDDRAPCCVGVGRLHVADGFRHLGGRGRGVVGREALACDLVRGGELARRIHGQREARHGRGRDRADSDVTGDIRGGDRRDARLGQDGEGVGRAEVDSFGCGFLKAAEVADGGGECHREHKGEHRRAEGDRGAEERCHGVIGVGVGVGGGGVDGEGVRLVGQVDAQQLRKRVDGERLRLEAIEQLGRY